jgi:hypothetical protein
MLKVRIRIYASFTNDDGQVGGTAKAKRPNVSPEIRCLNKLSANWSCPETITNMNKTGSETARHELQ